MNTEGKTAPKRHEKLWKEAVYSESLTVDHHIGNFNQSRLEQYRDAQVMGKVLPPLLPYKLNPDSRVAVAMAIEEIPWEEHTVWANRKQSDTYPKETQFLIF